MCTDDDATRQPRFRFSPFPRTESTGEIYQIDVVKCVARGNFRIG